jgi:hypothetical protein
MVKEKIQQQLVSDCRSLKMAGLAVGLALSRYFNRNAFITDRALIAYPGIKTLVKDTGLSHRAVQRAIRLLQKRQHFRIVDGGGGRTTHTYIGQLAEFQRCQSGSDRGVTPVIRTSERTSDPKEVRIRGGSRRPIRPRTLDAAHGRWPEILPHFGIEPKFLKNKHGPCPACGGKDRYRFTNRHGDGDYFCNQCGAGKGIKLVAEVNGVDYQTAAQRIDEYLGNEP